MSLLISDSLRSVLKIYAFRQHNFKKQLTMARITNKICSTSILKFKVQFLTLPLKVQFEDNNPIEGRGGEVVVTSAIGLGNRNNLCKTVLKS